MKHTQRIVGHMSGRWEPMGVCVCGKAWPCPELSTKTPFLADNVPWTSDDTGPRTCVRDMNGELVCVTSVEHAAFIVLACNSHAKLVAERTALRDELDLTKAGLEFAKDAAFRLAAPQNRGANLNKASYTKADVETICSIAVAAVNRQNKTTGGSNALFPELREDGSVP